MEHPSPTAVLDDKSTDDGADRGPDQREDVVETEGLTAFLSPPAVCKDTATNRRRAAPNATQEPRLHQNHPDNLDVGSCAWHDSYLNARSCALLRLKPHARLKMRYTAQVVWSIGRRPYTSESGLTTRGPTANARINTDRIICVWNSDWIAKSDWTRAKGGATMEDEMEEMDMKTEFKMVIPQRFVLLQFLGLAGSFGPSQVIWSEGRLNTR